MYNLKDGYLINNKNILTLLYFMILYTSSSFNISNISGSLSITLSIVVIAIILIFQNNIKINYNIIFVSILLCINVIITTVATNDIIKDFIVMIIVLIISIIFVLMVDSLVFLKIFNDLIYIISIYSLIVYIISLIAPNIISIFPITYNVSGMYAHNLGLTFVDLNKNLIRNMGLFWEPGAFQTYLVFAILIEKYIYNTNQSKRMVVFFFTLITTWSTAGIVNSFLLLLVFTIEKHDNKQFLVILKIICTLIFAVIIYNYLPPNIKYAIFGKIYLFFTTNNVEIGTASVRYDSTIYPLSAFLSNPIWGVGQNGLKESIPSAHFMTTNTVVNWFAAYGILYGSIFVFAIIKFSFAFNNKYKITYILIFMSVLLSLTTEQYLRNISINIIILSFYNLKPLKFNS